MLKTDATAGLRLRRFGLREGAMKSRVVPAEVIGPYVPWPHIHTDDEHRPTAVNPVRKEGDPTAHQADAQAPCTQAR